MARATRSSLQQPPSPPNSLPSPTKKRKRLNSPANGDDEQPPSKQQRNTPAITSAGDSPIDSEKAQKILDILEMIDAQGLLDRVFPLSSDSASASYSFRALLKDSSQYSLSVLRSAVQHLFPISSHPRARPSKPAAQQLKFCNLALSLLDQASVSSVDVSSDFSSLFPVNESATPDENAPQASTSKCPSSSSHLHQKPRYSLVQHLPQGDYWTSLNSSTSSSELKDLPKGNSELVSILPSPYPTASISDIPTLGSYHTKPLPSQKHKVPTRRPISRGSFLDYGIWASFAPSFDQDGAEVGRNELGEVYLAREMKRKQKEVRLKRWVAEREKQIQDEVTMDTEVEEAKPTIDVDAELAELLPESEVQAIKDSLQSFELEQAVSELLERNRKALRRLQELQYLRLVAKDGGSSTPEEGSEEWDTAQSILDSLSLLSSLRPRTSTGENPPLIPSPSALHVLHRALPLAPTSGWHGNLPPGRATALRDDSTIKVRPGVPAAPTNTAASGTAVAPSTTYGTYQYAAYTQAQTTQQGATTATTPYMMQYKLPGASGATSYFNHYTSQQMYGAQAYGTGMGTTAYGGGWYNSYTPQGVATAAGGTSSGTGSARGTPQPGLAPSYSSFFSNTGNALTAATATNGGASGRATPQAPAQVQLTPAVANTVMKPGQWGTPSGVSTPTAAVAGQTLRIPLPVGGTSVTQMRTHWPSGQQNVYQANGRSTPATK